MPLSGSSYPDITNAAGLVAMFVDKFTVSSTAILSTLDLAVRGVRVGSGAGNLPRNTVLGAVALNSNTTGDYNTATGYASLFANTSGIRNTAIGSNSLRENTSGSYNTAFGSSSLYFNSAGERNTAVGVESLYQATGSYNNGIGMYSGFDLTTGTHNTFIGYQAGRGITTGSYNVVIGNVQGLAAALSNTVVLGDGAGNTRLTLDSNGNGEFAGVGAGIILKSANGTRYKITVSNAGLLTAVAA